MRDPLSDADAEAMFGSTTGITSHEKHPERRDIKFQTTGAPADTSHNDFMIMGSFDRISTETTHDHDDRSAAGRSGTGHSLRHYALDLGFHGVPVGPAHPDRKADGADVS